MRAPAVSFAKRFVAAALAALLTFTLLPVSALAEGEGDTAVSAEETQDVNSNQAEEEAGADASEGAEPDTAVSAPLASVLAGAPTAFVNADVALNGEPVIGSFTVDGLTFAVTDDSIVELVGVSEAAGASPRRVVAESQGLDAPDVLPDLDSTPAASEAEVDSSIFALPESVAYNDVAYSVTSIGAYAFYLSGVTSVELPASVVDVDDRAFRSSDVASVEVAEGNPSYSFFDGALYDAEQLSLLLIPEGKQGTVLLPSTAESAAPSVFSHCPLVTQISVEEGSAAFASENGLLYTADLTTLLRVPAGATDITIREGCTTIAAGAMEACASLSTINAPVSVTSISPDVFTSVPTISLPAAALVEGAPQLTALVALSTTDDDLPRVDPLTIQVYSFDENVMTWPAFVGNASKISAAFEASHQSITKSEREPVYAAHDDSASTLVDIDDALTYGAGSNGSQIIAQNGHGRFYITQSNTSSYPVGYSTRFGIIGSIYTDWKMQITVADGTNGSKTSSLVCTSSGGYSYTLRGYTVPDEGYKLIGFNESGDDVPSMTSGTYTLANTTGTKTAYALFVGIEYRIMLDACGGYLPAGEPDAITAIYGQEVSLPVPERPGCRFLGWSSKPIADKDSYVGDTVTNLTTTDGQEFTFYAQWERVDYDLGFDTSSEPGDEDYPGIEKPDETINVDDGPTVIEDPKRPGYVFQGWVIPDAATDEGNGAKEALDQELVYQGDDGKWYVDASKLPDYANDDGRIELTARWTSVISVDVPSAVTFYADVVTQGNESREGAASSAFGQNKVASQSQVDLRIVGLESEQVRGNGSTALGASDILSKKDGGAVSGTADKLFSLYPTEDALTADDLQDPDAISSDKPDDAVDFALDDILLEGSFAADKFTIPAGDTLNLGYRLNLSETGTELDYDKLSTLEEGQSASIANISYCFATQGILPTGSKTDPLWVEVSNDFIAENGLRGRFNAGIYGLDDIKKAAGDLSTNGASSTYYSLYKGMLDRQVMTSGKPGAGPYFQLKVEGAVGDYLDLQLIGICQDTKSDGSGKAGLTFQMRDIYAYDNTKSTAAGGGPFNYTYMSPAATNSGGWSSSDVWDSLHSTFWECLSAEVQAAIVPVDKFHQLNNQDVDPVTGTTLQWTKGETVWLPSMHEVYGVPIPDINDSEGLSAVPGYAPFQYMAYQGNAGSRTNTRAVKAYNGSAMWWWLRSANLINNYRFTFVDGGGYGDTFYSAARAGGVVPCFAL